MQKACRVLHISVIPDSERPLVCHGPSQTQSWSKINHLIPAGTVLYLFYFKIMQNSPGPGTVQLFAGLHCTGDTNLLENSYLVRSSP